MTFSASQVTQTISSAEAFLVSPSLSSIVSSPQNEGKSFDLGAGVKKHRVYNFEVEGTHTYIADGMRVHNKSVLSFYDPERDGTIENIKFDPETNAVLSYDSRINESETVQVRVISRDPQSGTTTVARDYSYQSENGLFSLRRVNVMGKDENGNDIVISSELVDHDLFGDKFGGDAAKILTPFLYGALGLESKFEKLLGGSFLQALLQNTFELGGNLIHNSFLDEDNKNKDDAVNIQQLSESTLKDFGIELGQIGVDNVISFASGVVLSEIFGSVELNSVGEKIIYNLVEGGVDVLLTQGVDVFLEATGLFPGYQPRGGIDPIGIIVSTLFSEVLPELQSVEAKAASSFASLLASSYYGSAFSAAGFFMPIIGPAVIGALVGVVVDLIKGPPEAYADFGFNEETGLIDMSLSIENGRSDVVAKSLGTAVLKYVNQMLEALDSKSNNFSQIDLGRVGHKGTSYLGTTEDWYDAPFILDNISFFSSKKHKDFTPESVFEMVSKMRANDGDLKILRALNLNEFADKIKGMSNGDALSYFIVRLKVAIDYQKYLDNTQAINALMTSKANPDMAAAWIATLYQAKAYGLSDRYEAYGDDLDNNFITADGNDRVSGRDGDDIVKTYGGDDEIYGDGGNDSIDGGRGEDIVNGGSGDDTLDGGEGVDTIWGGDGNDTLMFEHAKEYVSLSLGRQTGWDGAAKGERFYSIENVIATDFNDYIHGSSTDNSIHTKGGDDIIMGFEGDDILNAGTGDDKVWAGKGNDTVNAGDGNDTVYAGQGNDKIISGSGNDEVRGGAGDDSINTGGGNDIIYEGSGQDIIDAGSGDDFIYAGHGSDDINGDEGIDTLSYIYNKNKGIYVDLESEFILQANDIDRVKNIENIIGSNNKLDYIVGNDKVSNIFEGRGGDDYLRGGGESSDTYIYSLGDGNDFIREKLSVRAEHKDKIIFENVRSDQVQYFSYGSDLKLVIDNKNIITLARQLRRYNEGIEIFEFADGVTLSESDVIAKTTGINNYANMWVNSSEEDTFTYQSDMGSYIIRKGYNSRFSDENRLVLKDFSSEDVKFSKSGDDFIIHLSNGEQITILNQLYAYYSRIKDDYSINFIEFSDGETLDNKGISNRLNQDMKTEGLILGTRFDDTYEHSKGDGSYIIRDITDNNSSKINTLTFNDTKLEDAVFSRIDDHLIIKLDNGEAITVAHALAGNQYQNSFNINISEIKFLGDVSLNTQNIRDKLVEDQKNNGDYVIGTMIGENYFYKSGDGSYTISDYDSWSNTGVDTLTFSDISSKDASFVREGVNLVIQLQNNEKITIFKHFLKTYGIISKRSMGLEKITFADGAVYEVDLETGLFSLQNNVSGDVPAFQSLQNDSFIFAKNQPLEQNNELMKFGLNSNEEQSQTIKPQFDSEGLQTLDNLLTISGLSQSDEFILV